MSASHHRSHSGQHQGGTSHMLAWEKQVLLGLMRVCMDSSTGQSSIDTLRDALITGYPQVLPEMKHKYGKFTAFLKANEAYFQINPFDRTVRLNAVHPDLISPITMPPDRAHSPMVPEQSNQASTMYSTSSSARDATSYSEKAYSSASAASVAAASRTRPVYTQPLNMSTSPDVGVSPRSHVGTIGRRANFSTHAPSASSSAGSLAPSNPSATQPSNPAPKHVSFSSLEQWEQMTVFAVLKYLLHTPNGIEHYTTLQERLNDPQLMSKYASLVDLLRLFPGNFLIDSFGYVSLADPAKARLQYPTLAAEFERRISTPPAPAADATNHLTVAFNNATSPWEKALLKTVWTILMAQTNHAANFPWLTTQLTRFKPWVKQNFGSLRLWAIQQTLFKFQGDTIYVPAHVAPSSSSSGLNAATAGLNSNVAPGPPPPMPPSHRATTATSSFAPVSSANFSIPVPPALPQRRTSTGNAQNPPPVPPPAAKPHSTFAKWNDQQPAWGPIPDDRARGRPQSSAPPGHKRQRSASPPSLRASGIPTAPSAHHRSQSSAADDMAMVIPVRFGYAPPPANTVTSSATAPSVMNASTNAAPMNIPKLNFPNSNTNPPNTSASHPFLRKTSASVESNRTSHMEATSPSTTTGPSPLNGPKERETIVLAAQAVSPRRLTPNPLYSIDKDIPNLSQVPLVVNRAGVTVKVVQTTEEVRKMVQFLSTFSCISVAAEIGEFESQVSSARRSRMSTEMIHSPTDDTSQSATSVIIASSPSGDYPETPTLVIGSAPSHATPNPLESHVASNNLSQDDSVLNRHRNTMSSTERMKSATQTSAENHQIEIIHEDREEKDYSTTTLDIAILCFSVRTSHGNSPHAPSSTLAGHSDKDLYKSHPVFVLDLHANPKFYRYIRGLLRSTSTLKVVYDCPKLADILYTQHGIHLANIIEVQVIHRLLWEISTLPQRFTHATGLETSLTQSEEISKSSDSSHGAKMSSGVAHLSDSSGSASKVAPGSNDSISGILARSSSNSSRSPSKPQADKQHSATGSSASSHQYHATLHPVHAVPMTHPSSSHHATQLPIPAMDATYGQLLQYFGVTLGGLSVPEKHPLLDAVEHNISGASIRTALWPAFSISPPALLRIIAVAATLIDLRILLATQLAVSLSKSALQLSQGFSHTHLPEFQNGEASGTTLTPLSHDQWMDAPELFSHLNE